MLHKLFKLLFMTTLAIILTTCESSYSKYYIEDYCLNSSADPHIELLSDSAINTSLLLKDSRVGHRLSDKICAVRIVMSKKVDGFIVTVQNISINNTPDKECEDFIQFGSSAVEKWCNSSDARSLIFSNSSVDIIFKTQSNSTSSFNIVITPYQNPISGQFCTTSAPFKCQKENQFQCISKIFSCDHINNCPDGFDEINCSQNSTFENIEYYMSDTIDNNQTATEISQTTTSETVTETEQIPIEKIEEYKEYNILDYCNTGFAHQIKLGSNLASSPAILWLAHNTSLSNQTCVVRFSLPESQLYPHQGLILGIDYISIKSNTNNSCDDYIKVSGANVSPQIQWCQNKTDLLGNTFRGSGYIDILFHAGVDSQSKFKFVITPFEDPVLTFCFKSSELKCKGTGDLSCISKQYRCDGHDNCPSGDDENGCAPTPNTTVTTSKPTTPITTPGKSTITTPVTTPSGKSTTAPVTTPSGKSTTTTHITTPSGNSTTTPSPPSKKLTTGEIVSIVVGTTVGIALIVIIVYLYVKRRRQGQGYRSLND